MSHLKLALLIFGCMFSGIYLMLSGVEVARHAYLRQNAGAYHKTTLQVDHFDYPLRLAGRKKPRNLMAHGTVEGRKVKVSLKTLRTRLAGLSRVEQLETLERDHRIVPIYKRTPSAADFLILGRSPGFLEADYFENGQPRAKFIFFSNLILLPALVMMIRRRLKALKQTIGKSSIPAVTD